MLNSLSVLETFTFLSWLFEYVKKRFDNRAMVNFKIYDATDCTKEDYKAQIANYLRKWREQDNETWSVIRI